MTNAHFTTLARDLTDQDAITYSTGADVAYKQLADLFNHARAQAQKAISTMLKDERGLDDADLQERYERAGEHPMFGKEAWQHEVAIDDTLLGYWLWVESKIIDANNA